MAIDPDFYEKVTGRRPGDALENLGRTIASSKPRDESDTSTFGAVMRGRMILRLIISVAALIAVAIALLAANLI